jgi:hypothetical protein
MFLYARLVVDYLGTNVFYSGEEMKESINQPPETISELYVCIGLSLWSLSKKNVLTRESLSRMLEVSRTLRLTAYSYRQILTQIFNHQDSRSVGRIRSILGWIAFAKRPLKKLELLSALSFNAGNPSITRLVPQYILDICSPLVEERCDSTISFIHVSVKESVVPICKPND